MVSRLRPLDLAISFEERTYELGETIDLTFELTPHRDCHIREGRVDLMVEERWTEKSTFTVEVPIMQRSSTGMSGTAMQVGTTTETKEIVKNTRKRRSTVVSCSWRMRDSCPAGLDSTASGFKFSRRRRPTRPMPN